MKIIITSIFLFYSLNSLATDLVGALSSGMGGTGRAAVENSESLFLNPAALSLMNKMHFSTGYQTGFLAKDVSRNTYGLTITDATSDVLVNGAFSYRAHKINIQGIEYKENEFRAGVGRRMTKRLSLGLGFAHLDATAPNGKSVKQNNFDLGLLFALTSNWGVSLTGENIMESDETLIDGLRRPSRLALSTQYILKDMFIGRYEALIPLYAKENDYLSHRFGLGITMNSGFMLNMGYSVDDFLQQNWSSVGLAWRGPRLKIAYSFQKEERQNIGDRHLIDLWVDI